MPGFADDQLGIFLGPLLVLRLRVAGQGGLDGGEFLGRDLAENT